MAPANSNAEHAMSDQHDPDHIPTEISESDLDQAATTGGVAMLLPAVQSARESYSSPPKKKSWFPWNLW